MTSILPVQNENAGGEFVELLCIYVPMLQRD